jgi:hypothetical protein
VLRGRGCGELAEQGRLQAQVGDHFPVAPAGHPARSLRIDRGDGGRDGLPLARQGIAHLLTVLGHLTIVAYAAVLPYAMSDAAAWWLGCR